MITQELDFDHVSRMIEDLHSDINHIVDSLTTFYINSLNVVRSIQRDSEYNSQSGLTLIVALPNTRKLNR
jgi:hypothetical protein